MKRYEPTTNCENAVMVENENGDYVDFSDASMDIKILIEQISYLQEIVGDELCDEDAEMLAQIKQVWFSS